MTFDWTGAGKGAEFFGAADYDRALRSGKSIQDVRNYLSSSAGQASLRKTASGSVDPAVANLVETKKFKGELRLTVTVDVTCV